MRKMFVAEGPDFAGKTTVLNLVEKYLSTEYKFDRTYEPGGTVYSMILRDAMKDTMGLSNLAYLFGMLSARADHLTQRIIPSFADSDFVLCDRFDLSTFVYQVYYQKDTDKYQQLLDIFISTRQALMNDTEIEIHYILLDVSSKVAGERRAAACTNRDRETSDQIEKTYSDHEKLRSGYQEALKIIPDMPSCPSKKYCINTDDLTPEQSAGLIKDYIKKQLE
jgi:dTMP kinase